MVGLLLDFKLFWTHFYFSILWFKNNNFINILILLIYIRARIEKRNSLSGILECRERICEEIPNPYTTFYDYVQDMVQQQQKGIKEICCVGSIWDTPQPQYCTIFPLLPKQETDLFQVLIPYKINPCFLVLSYYTIITLLLSFWVGGVRLWAFFSLLKKKHNFG